MTTEHLAASTALAIAALPESDAERQRAEAHAVTCPACRALLAEGVAMLKLLDDSEQLTPVHPAVQARIKAQLLAAPDTSRFAKIALAAMTLLSGVLALLQASGEGLHARVGADCLLFEQGTAMVPWGLAAAYGAWSRTQVSAYSLAAFAMGGAIAGQLLLHLRCPVPHAMAHLFLFHVLGVVLAAAVGGFAGRKLLHAA